MVFSLVAGVEGEEEVQDEVVEDDSALSGIIYFYLTQVNRLLLLFPYFP